MHNRGRLSWWILIRRQSASRSQFGPSLECLIDVCFYKRTDGKGIDSLGFLITAEIRPRIRIIHSTQSFKLSRIQAKPAPAPRLAFYFSGIFALFLAKGGEKKKARQKVMLKLHFL